MEPDDLRALFRTVPFKPFVLYMNDGSSFEVKHPDQAMVIGEVFFAAQDNRAVRCSTINVSRVEPDEVVSDDG